MPAADAVPIPSADAARTVGVAVRGTMPDGWSVTVYEPTVGRFTVVAVQRRADGRPVRSVRREGLSAGEVAGFDPLVWWGQVRRPSPDPAGGFGVAGLPAKPVGRTRYSAAHGH